MNVRNRWKLLKQRSLLVFAPTGLRLEAQGCRALTATLGKVARNIFNRNAVAPRRGFREFTENAATALRLSNQSFCFSQGSRQSPATLGFMPQPRWGKEI
jgi:hypothetical protein